MDPFLEGNLWPDVHNEMASKIRRQLMPLIKPKYVARINTYVVEDIHPESDLGIMYPDVELIYKTSRQIFEEPAAVYADSTKKLKENITTPVTFSVPFLVPVEVKIPFVEIRDGDNNRLITCIEILSPVNKRNPGLEAYLEKRKKLHRAGVHLLEIDLLRRGDRTVKHPKTKSTDYLIALTRAGTSHTEIWTVDMRSVLPTVPIPLMENDGDVSLDLQKALDEVYEDAAYELSIDYSKQPPPPKLSKENRAWIKTLL